MVHVPQQTAELPESIMIESMVVFNGLKKYRQRPPIGTIGRSICPARMFPSKSKFARKTTTWGTWGFPKIEVPLIIIHFSRIIPNQSSILGYLHLWKPPYIIHFRLVVFSVVNPPFWGNPHFQETSM